MKFDLAVQIKKIKEMWKSSTPDCYVKPKYNKFILQDFILAFNFSKDYYDLVSNIAGSKILGSERGLDFVPQWGLLLDFPI